MLSCIEKSKSFIKKKLLIMGIVGMLCFVGCGTDKNVEAEAGKIVEAVENKDMETVEAMILGTSELAVDEEFAEFFVNSDSENDGIISKIIEQDSIKVKKITNEYIVYEITAPDLSNMFQDVMKEGSLTADGFEDYIYNYIATIDKAKITVEVPYTYENEVFIADYSTQEFMNGITGNLVTAYQKLIQQMIEEYSGENVQ